MLILIASSFAFVLVSNVKVSSEGEGIAVANQMMEGTPFPPFLVATFGSRHQKDIFNRSCAFKYSPKYRM
jgi:hypothetical protein